MCSIYMHFSRCVKKSYTIESEFCYVCEIGYYEKYGFREVGLTTFTWDRPTKVYEMISSLNNLTISDNFPIYFVDKTIFRVLSPCSSFFFTWLGNYRIGKTPDADAHFMKRYSIQRLTGKIVFIPISPHRKFFQGKGGANSLHICR